MGMILTGVFASTIANPSGANGLLYGGFRLFGYHMLALVIVACFSFFGSYILFKIVNVIIPLRVSADDEAMGLDLSQHGETLASEIPTR